MAQLCLTTVSGNSMPRHFPVQGYLGLTPVHVEGIVQIRLDPDQKPIPARRLTVSVRAYESRRTGVSQSHALVDYSQTLWSKPQDQSCADIGEFQSPFKITLPKDVAGFSTANYQDYRTFWRVEATLEHAMAHRSETDFAKRFDLMLTRHDIPRFLDTPPLPQGPFVNSALPLQTTKPRAPVLHYNISTPTHAIGPTDLLFTSVFIRPADAAVTLRSASLLVERRLVLSEPDRPVSPPRSPPTSSRARALASPGAERTSPDDNVFAFGVARSPSLQGRASAAYPSPPPTSSDGRQKAVTTTVAAAQGAAFAHDATTGVWTKTISLQWPAAKGQSRWPVGETVKGVIGTVSFWVKVKVIVTSPSGTESIDLQPREIVVVLTSDADRRRAMEVSNIQADSTAEYTPPPYTAPAPAEPRPAAAPAFEWGEPAMARLPMSYSPNGAPRTAGSMSSSRVDPALRQRKGFKATLARLLGRENKHDRRS
ncbi:hypothetical protein PsYK624_043930 [Phanerochaete sordida]|uniref:Uncharacterized protein n=1 Tax=Phanerochaete sordida TaxID=48140 RepID=A0A9P3G5Q0_9APHY|nr:hypothetical protein PsYK624_043930 [Phanerochaete sordida]